VEVGANDIAVGLLTLQVQLYQVDKNPLEIFDQLP